MNHLLLSLALLLSLSLCGQQRDTFPAVNRLQIGIGGGFMQHEVAFTPPASEEVLLGTSFGVGLRYFDNHLVGFQAELSITNAGWRETLDTSFASLYERNVTYVELLILSQLSIGKGAFQPMLQGGPYLSFPLQSKENIPTEYVAPITTTGLPQYYDFELPFRVNYGVQIGVGFNLELGPLTIQADGRFLIGFSDLIKTGTTIASTSRRQGLGGHVGVFYAL